MSAQELGITLIITVILGVWLTGGLVLVVERDWSMREAFAWYFLPPLILGLMLIL